jgi:hypothetical protein
MAVTKGVPTNQQTYSFIVTSNQQQYTITLSCAYYLNPGNPSAGDTASVQDTLTFHAVKPSTATLTAVGGNATFTVAGGAATLAYSPSIQFTANTQSWGARKGDAAVSASPSLSVFRNALPPVV